MKEKIGHKRPEDKFFSLLCLVIITFVFLARGYCRENIPLPPNSEPIAGNNDQYRSRLSQSEILRFYQDKLTQGGWEITSTPSQAVSEFNSLDRTFSFRKGDDELVLTFSPFTVGGFVFYSLGSKITSPAEDTDKTQIQPQDNMPEEPQSLDFMPVFPGSKQVDRRRISSSLYISYLTNQTVEKISGFYRKEMPSYGWKFIGQENIDKKGYDLSELYSTCPTCPKIPLQSEELLSNLETTGVALEFKERERKCVITIAKMGNLSALGVRDLTSPDLGDTIITVLYDDKK